MIEILCAIGLLLLIPSAILVVLHYLDNIEDVERKELQKLLAEISGQQHVKG